MNEKRDWSDYIFGIFVTCLVVVLVVIALSLLLTPDGHYHVQVTDKQVVPMGASASDLIVSAMVDGHKQIFLARNSVVFAAITVGDTCDFTTYVGGQSVIVIRAADCKGGGAK